MSIQHVIILGAGPCGLSTAIALSKTAAKDGTASQLHITIMELRPKLQTIGGTLNMTPLAMRYLDYLGAGQRLRERSISLNTGVDVVSLRLGWRMGSVWGGIGARRTARQSLVESLYEVASTEHSDTIAFQWGKHVTHISDTGDHVTLTFDDQTTLQGDVLLACDGIHSSARHLFVEPERKKIYSGRAVTMGWAGNPAGPEASGLFVPVTLLSGSPAIRDTTAFNGNGNVLITSYYEPTRQNIFFAHVRWMEEQSSDERDEWKVLGKDAAHVRNEVLEAYRGGRVQGLESVVEKCRDWHLYPIYKLPPGGRWHKGRVLLLGDAAHAVGIIPSIIRECSTRLTSRKQMPPQGESTGIAIEDGVLIAEVFKRRANRSVEQMFNDYEDVRRSVIDKRFVAAERMAKFGFAKPSGFLGLVMELVTAIFMQVTKWLQSGDHFRGDVRGIKLPE